MGRLTRVCARGRSRRNLTETRQKLSDFFMLHAMLAFLAWQPRLAVRPSAVRVAASAAGSSPAQLFSHLLSSPGVRSAVELSPPVPQRGRGLVTRRAIEPGEELLFVPSELLLTAHRSGVVSGLQGQTDATWDAVGDLRDEVGEEMYARGATWDVRLALALFEACAGAAGGFWDQYITLLPPHRCSRIL